MRQKLYQWVLGKPAPILGSHSIAKHNVLREYLERYVAILTSRIVQQQLRLTLVDGFAGGGLYRHPATGDPLIGSPLIMLEAMAAASASAKAARTKDFSLDVQYFFVEVDELTCDFLRQEIKNLPAGRDQWDKIQILPGSFSAWLKLILHRISEHSKSRRVIFVLDQYGYSEVKMSDLQQIFRSLPNAEVILTVATDWLIDHFTDSENFRGVIDDLGIGPEIPLLTRLKESREADWRPSIQCALHQRLFKNSGASYYTPFFIHSTASHRAYWLLHFSNHSKARDAMAELHWSLKNHFQHFGRPGLCMLGYDPARDAILPFSFDGVAENATHISLRDDIPRRIINHRDGIAFGNFFESVVNETPATKQMLSQSISSLTLEKELEVRTKDGKLRRNGVRIEDDDIVLRPMQRKLILPG